ncbi:MAG: hypothetical protein V3S49_00745 [Thermodesulfobacteriota bacterium]
MGEKKPLVNLALKSLLVLIGVYVFFKYCYGYISMWITNNPFPQHLPDQALKIYLLCTLFGILIYVTSSEERKKDFLDPVKSFLAGGQGSFMSIIRMVVLILIPLITGFKTYESVVPKLQSVGGIRIMHPTMPRKFEGLVSPAREPLEEAAKVYISEKRFQGSFKEAKAALAEENMMDGRVSFAKNCRPCHGMQANGKGPMAWGWRLKPADFTDPGILPTIVESYAFWRVSKGSPGLPSASTPWDSSMPAWDINLPEHAMWQVLLGAYDLAGVGPRQPEALEGYE